MAAGGSREQAQRLEFNRADRSKEASRWDECLAKRSREPLAAKLQSCQLTKRLPSRRGSPPSRGRPLESRTITTASPTFYHTYAPSTLTVGPANTE
jgi:hypothetical protein